MRGTPAACRFARVSHTDTLEPIMSHARNDEPTHWWVLALMAAIATPVFTVLWLGITLTSDALDLPSAVVKILFTIVAVGTAALGARWMTASGVALLLEMAVVVAWVLIRADDYSTTGLIRTSLLLALPLAVSGTLYVLAGGMKAGTWPPDRFRNSN